MEHQNDRDKLIAEIKRLQSQAEYWQNKYYEQGAFFDSVLRVDNHASSTIDKAMVQAIYRRFERIKSHRYYRGEYIQVFTSWLAEDTGLDRKTVYRSLKRLMDSHVIKYIPDSIKNNGNEIRPYYWLALYPDTPLRLATLIETAPRKLGKQRVVYCQDCGRDVEPIIKDRVHRRYTCPHCDRTFRDKDFLRVIPPDGKVKEMVLSEHDYTEEKHEQRIKKVAPYTHGDKQPRETLLDDLPVDSGNENEG